MDDDGGDGSGGGDGAERGVLLVAWNMFIGGIERGVRRYILCGRIVPDANVRGGVLLGKCVLAQR